MMPPTKAAALPVEPVSSDGDAKRAARALNRIEDPLVRYWLSMMVELIADRLIANPNAGPLDLLHGQELSK